jgi:hypothetical protein
MAKKSCVGFDEKTKVKIFQIGEIFYSDGIEE